MSFGAFLIFILVGLSAVASPVLAQDLNGRVDVDPTVHAEPSIDPLDLGAQGTSEKTGGGPTPLFAPVPFKNTQVGWGLAVVAGVIHRFDPDTTLKPSTGAVTGFYTENHSWGWALLEMARIQHDAWRLRGLISHFDVRYDFYGIGEAAGQAGASIPLEQKMDFAVASALHRVSPGFYAGASALWLQTSAEVRSNPGTAPPPASQDLSQAELLAPGLLAELDTRNDDYWPSRGSLGTLKANFFTGALGSTRDFQRYAAGWSWYTELPHARTLLATNLNASAVAGDAPFYAIPSIGSGAYGLRGYTQGRYRDNLVTTAQAEIRWHNDGRIGAVIFGGFGQVAPSIGKLTDAKVLPAGGVGVRFQLTRQYPMHLRGDVAWGRDEPLFYFSVGEAF